jgi:iron(III) transport system permease protein
MSEPLAEPAPERPRAGSVSGVPWLALGALIAAALAALPLLSVLANLLEGASPNWPHLSRTVLPGYLVNTLFLALAVGPAVALIGASSAWLTTMCAFPLRRVFDWALILPLAVPAYVMAYAYTDFLDATGPVQTALRALTGLSVGEYWFPAIRSLPGAAAMLALVLYPYVYLLARASFLEQSVGLLDVARTLGHGPWSTFFRVALPLARPAIIAGTAFALMETLADFGTVAYFGVPTFTTGIYRAWFSLGDALAANQLAALLLVFIALLFLAERASRGRRGFQHTTAIRPLPSFALKGVRAGLALLACALPLVLGFVLPASILSALALKSGGLLLRANFLHVLSDSATLAASTALIALALALVLALATRRSRDRATQGAAAVASLGYAVPGSIIAVGVLVPFAAFDRALDAFAHETFGFSTGLLFTGSLLALVYACVVRFLAVALQTVEASFARLPRSLDDAARVLGAGALGSLVRVHMPLMAASLFTALLIVFVDVLKELPATILMRPFNFTTLAVEAYNLAADERLKEAASVSLVIVAVALVPVVLLARAIARARPGSPPPLP